MVLKIVAGKDRLWRGEKHFPFKANIGSQHSLHPAIFIPPSSHSPENELAYSGKLLGSSSQGIQRRYHDTAGIVSLGDVGNRVDIWHGRGFPYDQGIAWISPAVWPEWTGSKVGIREERTLALLFSRNPM